MILVIHIWISVWIILSYFTIQATEKYSAAMYYTWPSSTVVIVPPPSLKSKALSKSRKLFFLGTTCQKMKRCLCIPQVFLRTNPLEPEMFQIHTWILSCTTWDQKKIYFACEGNIGFWILDENFALGLADHHIDHFRWTNPSSVLSIMNYELQTCPWHEIKAQFQKLWFDFKYLKTKMNACMDPTTNWKIHPSALMLSSFLADDVRTSHLCKWMIIIGQEKKPIHLSIDQTWNKSKSTPLQSPPHVSRLQTTPPSVFWHLPCQLTLKEQIHFWTGLQQTPKKLASLNKEYSTFVAFDQQHLILYKTPDQ